MLKTEIKLTQEQIEKFQQEIEVFNDKQVDIFFGDLIDVFANTDFEDDYNFRESYLRWFTKISLKRFLTLSDIFLKDLFFSKQLSEAFLLGYDVLDNFLFYLASQYYLAEENRFFDFYNSVLNITKKSGAIFGEIDGKKIFFSEVVNKYIEIKDKQEFKNYLEGLILEIQNGQDDYELYFNLDEKLVAGNIIKFFDFIFGIKKENVLDIADIYARTGELLENKENNKIEEKKLVSAPTYSEIKAKILQFFPKDENGEIIDNEGVFEVLEKTAEKYGDPKIKEIYYYDEESEKFKWST